MAENGREILLSLKNVDITFGKGDDAVRAVQDASFDIYKGETFSLVGESGSGKTTIGRAVIRVNPLAGGEIDYQGGYPEYPDGVPGPRRVPERAGHRGLYHLRGPL